MIVVQESRLEMFETLCRDCGCTLFAEVQQTKTMAILRIEPCRHCTESAKETGYEEGYDEGHQDGTEEEAQRVAEDDK